VEDLAIELSSEAQQLGMILEQKGLTVSFAESCTGGLVCKAMTDRAGASNYFKGGIVAYSNEIKNQVLGVSEFILNTKGAVSSETAEAMVTGLTPIFKTEVSGSITGIAGPDGGTDEKPVGTVWFSLRVFDEKITEKVLFDGDRDKIRLKSAIHIIKMIIEKITEA
jgi:PncC family amidohydrolase